MYDSSSKTYSRCVWLTGRDAVEIPWWTYGAAGMQLWFPSSLTEPLSPSIHSSSASLDPELEFDKEVYPIGISLSDVAIIGEPSMRPYINHRKLPLSSWSSALHDSVLSSCLALYHIVPCQVFLDCSHTANCLFYTSSSPPIYLHSPKLIQLLSWDTMKRILSSLVITKHF